MKHAASRRAHDVDAVFISPHLDDAVLSAAHTILHYVNRHKRVLVVTLFTRGSDATGADIRSFLEQCGGLSADALFRKRRIEDRRALAVLGVRQLQHAGMTDALFRTTRGLPVYPSFVRLFSGRIPRTEHTTITRATRYLQRLKRSVVTPKTHVYTALGVGNHADHLITHHAVTHVFGKRTRYWEDVPYRATPVNVFRRLSVLPQLVMHGIDTPGPAERKKSAIGNYATQLTGLFQDGLGDIDYLHEVLYAHES